jgi:hypothetical protein
VLAFTAAGVVSTEQRRLLLIRAELGERLQALLLLQLELDRRPETNRDSVELKELKAAVQHLEASIRALTRTSSG